MQRLLRSLLRVPARLSSSFLHIPCYRTSVPQEGSGGGGFNPLFYKGSCKVIEVVKVYFFPL